MHDDDIKRAIFNKTICLIASIENKEARYDALSERLREIAGMIELARYLGASDALLRFLESEQLYLRREIEAVK